MKITMIELKIIRIVTFRLCSYSAEERAVALKAVDVDVQQRARVATQRVVFVQIAAGATETDNIIVNSAIEERCEIFLFRSRILCQTQTHT